MKREILVMDSEERENFWITLKSDYRILFATTAKEGLNLLSANVELVFISLILPDMNGLEVMRLIEKVYPSTAVIIIASHGAEETHMEAFRQGARDFIKKPLKADAILEKIKMLLDIDDVSPRRRHLPFSAKMVQDEHFPDVPSHLVAGVLKVRDFISQNYSESLTLAAACKMASLSKTYFCRFFKRITGYSLRNYHHVVKIRMAEELLKDKRMSVTDVALRLGYDDPNYFSTIYKKIAGVSPKQRLASHRSPQRDSASENSEKL